MSRHHRRDSTMAAMLFSIVIVFLFSHTPRFVLNIFEAVQVVINFKFWFYIIVFYKMIKYGTIQLWPEWADVLSRINHFMLVFNSSVNIVIYTLKVNHFY